LPKKLTLLVTHGGRRTGATSIRLRNRRLTIPIERSFRRFGDAIGHEHLGIDIGFQENARRVGRLWAVSAIDIGKLNGSHIVRNNNIRRIIRNHYRLRRTACLPKQYCKLPLPDCTCDCHISNAVVDYRKTVLQGRTKNGNLRWRCNIVAISDNPVSKLAEQINANENSTSPKLHMGDNGDQTSHIPFRRGDAAIGHILIYGRFVQ